MAFHAEGTGSLLTVASVSPCIEVYHLLEPEPWPMVSPQTSVRISKSVLLLVLVFLSLKGIHMNTASPLLIDMELGHFLFFRDYQEHFMDFGDSPGLYQLDVDSFPSETIQSVSRCCQMFL